MRNSFKKLKVKNERRYQRTVEEQLLGLAPISLYNLFFPFFLFSSCPLSREMLKSGGGGGGNCARAQQVKRGIAAQGENGFLIACSFTNDVLLQ